MLDSEPESSVIVDSYWSGALKKSLRIEQKEDPAAPEVSVESGRAILNIEQDTISVEPSEKKTIELGTRKVMARARGNSTRVVDDPFADGEKMEVMEPGDVEEFGIDTVIKIRNHGRLGVYGSPDAEVFPMGSDNQYAKNRVSSVLSVTPNKARSVSPNKAQSGTNGLLVLSRGGGQE